MATKRSEIGGAIINPNPNHEAPRQTTRARKGVMPQARNAAKPIARAPAAEIHEIPEAGFASQPSPETPPETTFDSGQAEAENQVSLAAVETHLGGQVDVGNQLSHAAQTPLPQAITNAPTRAASPAANPSGTAGAEEGHVRADNHALLALLGDINATVRRYNDLRRAYQRLELQAIATCRTVCGGDKTAGMKLYKDPTPQVGIWLMPYEAAMAPLVKAIAEHEKLLEKLGKKLPVSDWAKTVAGLGPRFLAMIVGECGIGPGEYRTVSGLWKRMGLAVIDGKRQRRVTGDAAIEHGYVARRRSLMWNIGESVIKQQVRNPKDADGKAVGLREAKGYYGQVYIDRRIDEAIKDQPTNAVIHNRAKRYMEKRLLRELWRAWRAAT